ncbi:flagellin [Clostridium ragsdalei P11]|uniref:Flagellin n=1 Tax=Clostridium ragsdalei P11 TaxID=1353534 RepID=A0A1A6AY93_9CLOT|nr:flagellin [Clostridium ragsdalei]OBR95000.1 flagellin [Clostridium ragsdalei P11]
MVINHNINAVNVLRYMSINTSKMAKAAKRLSSGLAINSASDNPSGLVVSRKMKSRIIGLEQASRNAQDDISAVQVADGALDVTTSILQRMKQLATEAANGTLKDQDRKNIQCEINQLTSEINDIGDNTEFNTIKLLSFDGKNNGVNSKFAAQAGANLGQCDVIKVEDMKAKALNISGESGGSVTSKDGKVTAKLVEANPNDKDNVVTDGNDNKTVEYALDMTDPKNASAAIKIYSDAIGKVSCFRVGLRAALQNVLQCRIDCLGDTASNISASESKIEDADMAKEMINYSRYNILSQASQAMLVQANRNSSERMSQLLKSFIM